jgi:hypothetical protein
MSTNASACWRAALTVAFAAAMLCPQRLLQAAEAVPVRPAARCLCLIRFCPKPAPCLPRPFHCGCCPTYVRKDLPTACQDVLCQPATYCAKPLPCPPQPVGCCPD